nr:hypothetical protein [Deltaproteobacteria bacterium]
MSRSLAIDLWILPEDNRLTARVSPIDDGDELPFLDIALGARNEPEPLCRLRWKAPQRSFEPFSIDLPVVFDSATAKTQLWGRETPPVTSEDGAAAQELGMRFLEALARRDAATVSSLVSFRTEETARAFQLDARRLGDSVRAQFEETLAAPGFRVAPLAKDAIRMTPCAGNRVFYLSRDDGGELMEVSHDRGTERGQVYVARVDARWTIVR